MKKINIAELLKDCPTGIELDSTIVNGLYFDEVTFDEVTENNLIKCYTKFNSTYNTIYFYSDGSYLNHTCSKCVIFPKGKTTWEGFHRPFDDGDIVATEHGLFIGIVRVKNNMQVNAYCSINYSGRFEINSTYGFERIATEEEKQKLFDAIKANGYRWNAETKTLEKLTEQKFDITTLKPFDKVLVRDNEEQMWTTDIFSFYNEKHVYHFMCVGHYTNQCIPFEGNEHLLGKTDDCDEFYKTWE